MTVTSPFVLRAVHIMHCNYNNYNNNNNNNKAFTLMKDNVLFTAAQTSARTETNIWDSISTKMKGFFNV